MPAVVHSATRRDYLPLSHPGVGVGTALALRSVASREDEQGPREPGEGRPGATRPPPTMPAIRPGLGLQRPEHPPAGIARRRCREGVAEDLFVSKNVITASL